MIHEVINEILENAEPYTCKFRERLEAIYKEIEQAAKQFGWQETASQTAVLVNEEQVEWRSETLEQQQKTLARLDLFGKWGLDYDGEKLLEAMEDAYKCLDSYGGTAEAKEIVSVIDDHRETFELIAPEKARELYKRFSKKVTPQQNSTTGTDTNSHFNQQYETESLRNVFSALKNENLLSEKYNSTDDWLFVHTGTPGPAHRSLVWLGSVSALADLINLMYSKNTEHRHKWAVTANCFVVENKNGEQNHVNVDNIKKQSKYSRIYQTIKQSVKSLTPLKAQ